jgi:uncharacterized protein YndB with AHSA1/START domain
MSVINAQDGKAITEKTTFSRTTSISEEIYAPIEQIWELLTDAHNMSSWNTTIVSLEGEIKVGEKIKLKSTLDPSRIFKLKVKEMNPPNKLVWGDAMGERVYLLTKTEEGVTFSMTEKIGGLMFPLFANKIPPFDESFEAFAADLKKTAESKG